MIVKKCWVLENISLNSATNDQVMTRCSYVTLLNKQRNPTHILFEKGPKQIKKLSYLLWQSKVSSIYKTYMNYLKEINFRRDIFRFFLSTFYI